MRILRALALFSAVFLAIAALCALVGALFAYFRDDTTYANAIAWAMWVGGGLIVLLVGMSGSPARRAEDSRVVVGGRFVAGGDIPQPQSPFVAIPAGLLVIGLGVLIFMTA
jgi:hypothetical protein